MLPRSASGRCPLSLYSSLLLIGRLPSGPPKAPHTLSAPSASELGFPVELLPPPPTSFLAGTTGRVQLLPDDRGSRGGQEGRPGAAGHGRGCSWLAWRVGGLTPAGEEAREWLLRSARAGFPPALLGEEPLHSEPRLQQPRVSPMEALAFRAASVAPQRGEKSLGTRLADNIVTGGERRTAQRVRPFLKWAGGKGQLVAEIARRLPPPDTLVRYVEPFVGGGAFFFWMRENHPDLRCRIADRNVPLVDTYLAVRDAVEELITALRPNAEKHSSNHYYAVRRLQPTDPGGRAARFTYLNRTCYNGLWRGNRGGR